MKPHYWKAAALLCLVVAACFVPALEDLDEEKLRDCDASHPCLEGYACVEGHCQPEAGTACRGGTTAVCGLDVGECQAGVRTCSEDGTYGACAGAVQPVAEVCNGKDDDCDGQVDEGLSCTDGGDPCAACAVVGRACANGLCTRCLDGYFEEGDECVPKLGVGTACARAEACGSGFCVDGVCCGSACTGPCEQCKSTPGTCAPMADGQEGDPSCIPYRCDGSNGSCPTQCAGNADCASGNFCINGRCGDKLPVGATCTATGQCASGYCVGGICCGDAACESPPSQCHQPVGVCTNGTCSYEPKPAATTCDDGNACTVNDVCNGSGSCSGSPMACSSPPSQCHESAGACSGGRCIYALKSTGSACDDGNSCTTSDVCNSSGTCGGAAMTCNSPPSQCHQNAGVCANGQCTYPLKTAGTTCSDGNTCTTGDVCSSTGVCTGTGVTCNSPPNNQCYQAAGVCSNGQCTYTPKTSGSACDDGNSCTTGDVCNGAGTCGGTAMTCNSPPSQCHQNAGVCANGQCTYPLKTAGTTCSDGNTCTTGDVCSSTGVCAGTGVICNSPPNACYQAAGVCSNGQCTYTPKTSGSACDDGNSCTTGDVCNGAGTCGGTAMTCNSPPSQCHQNAGVCANGQCTYPLKTAGTTCSDGNTCTTGDVCSSTGVCAGTGVICNSPPNNQCYQAAGVCSNGQCTYTPKTSGSACDDGNSCTTGDVCNGSGTCGGTAMTCNSPPSQCHQNAGVCANGVCSYPLKTAGTTCSDGNTCTTGDVCSSTGVCGGSAITCNTPPNQCYQAAGVCANGQCTYTPKASGTGCDDGNSCTTGDVCNGAGTCGGSAVTCNSPPGQCSQSTGVCSNGSCSYPPKPSGASCDDGNSCTTNDRCDGAGTCVVTDVTCTTPPTQCHQTVGSCSNGACSYPLKPAGSSCNDGNLCTNNDVCNSSGACGGATITCNDNLECTADSCSPSSGCTYTNLGAGTACSSDGKACTRDMCDGAGACTHPQFCTNNQTCTSSGTCGCVSPNSACTGSQGNYCANLQTDVRNCGQCGWDCYDIYGPNPGGIVSCNLGNCRCRGSNGLECPIAAQ